MRPDLGHVKVDRNEALVTCKGTGLLIDLALAVLTSGNVRKRGLPLVPAFRPFQRNLAILSRRDRTAHVLLSAADIRVAERAAR